MKKLYLLLFVFGINSSNNHSLAQKNIPLKDSLNFNYKIEKLSTQILLSDSAISTGTIGISIYDLESNKYWYNYNATQYFTPASNTKLFTLYAGMKYLGDSLVGLRYNLNKQLNDTIVDITFCADPSFLNPEFSNQPVFNFLNQQKKIVLNKPSFNDTYGLGWSWDDYTDLDMKPITAIPMYANALKIKWVKKDSIIFNPKYFKTTTTSIGNLETGFQINNDFETNQIIAFNGIKKNIEIPFKTDINTIINLLKDTLKNSSISIVNGTQLRVNKTDKIIHSLPSDSLFKPMMHRSNNYYAEQILQMVSNEFLGYMKTNDIIDTLLKTDLKELPNKPQWVDGCGLSRYNLFTPKDFIFILKKMYSEFGFKRLKNILPTGGEGTLKNYYKNDAGFIFAKTGTLSNNCALSGYLITQKGKLLAFSILANNYITPATPVRKVIEKYLHIIRENN